MKVDFVAKDNAVITVDLPGGPEQIDLQQAFSYSHDIDGCLEQHAGWQATWEYQALAKKEEIDLFFELTYETYMTHLRTYARYAARGTGEKPERITMEMTKDYLIRIYSEKTSAEERKRLSQAAFKGLMLEQKGSLRLAETYISGLSMDAYQAELIEFYRDMFAYQQDAAPPVYWYEEMARLRLRKQREKEEYELLAMAFRNRGYLLKQGAENSKARMINMGGMTVEDLVNNVVAKLRKLQGAEVSQLPPIGMQPKISPYDPRLAPAPPVPVPFAGNQEK